jgi:hypothetical protein
MRELDCSPPAYLGGLSSPANQPSVAAFMGSLETTVV